VAEKRVVLITGGGKGLGRAFALDLAKRGARVVVNNRVREGQPDSAAHVVQEIAAAGGNGIVETSDVTDDGAAERMVERALQTYGRLDGIIFNAGITGDAKRFVDMDAANFDLVMATNFASVVRLTRHALPTLRKSPSARLLYVSSSAGLYGVRGRSPYASSKGALQAFALNMAIEEARNGCRTNIVLPYALTQMTRGTEASEGDHALSADKVAPFVSWLASEDCHLNGTVWTAGAGLVRQVRTLETVGAMLPSDGDIKSWYLENREKLDELDASSPRTKHAEHAFEQFMQAAAAKTHQ
tara:strand:- start:475 stop:1371 length:897 start_codon:yes stop_codon:yes gene_type:complete